MLGHLWRFVVQAAELTAKQRSETTKQQNDKAKQANERRKRRNVFRGFFPGIRCFVSLIALLFRSLENFLLSMQQYIPTPMA